MEMRENKFASGPVYTGEEENSISSQLIYLIPSQYYPFSFPILYNIQHCSLLVLLQKRVEHKKNTLV
jgi:hypothetical protein